MNGARRAELIFQVSFYLSRGFNQKDIAQRLGIKQQMVSYYKKCLYRAYLDEIKEFYQ